MPTGGAVSAGAASISQPNASTLNINQSTNQAIINWNTFSVGRGDTVNFNQPGAASSTLNRVLGSTPSWIAGTINAPGTVLLINPNGIEITRSGVVNTGSFVASTLNIKDSDYLNGNYRFNGNGGSAGVINNGRIYTADGGFAALLGGQVSNNGVIVARLGRVALGAGEEATLDLSGDGFLSVGIPSTEMGKLVNANGALVSNRGKIVADGGMVFLSAATAANILRNAVNIPGSIRTNSVGVHNGRIVINGGGGNVSITGKLAANGGKKHNGGSIAVTGGDINVSGTLSANGANGGTISVIANSELTLAGTLMAEGYRGQGGQIDLTAAGNVMLTGATVNASGASGGGVINIGGGPHATVALADAQSLLIDAATTISANATNNGNGGHIVAWSDGLTTVAGTLSAMGGPNGGNGGLIETSGETVDLAGINVTTAAPQGATGTWLIDPSIVAICTGAACSAYTGDTIISSIALATELGSTNETVTATSSIYVASPVAWG
ncbi:MAG TPA: filamentous hemagglutinin N-terminal domain-containing protein, partial [Xanthobacteraceae bacterium]|nr:filamentous hemagglutinin N-terminal domain-containing protein [Xanthobacteraceae bacterium]